MIRINLLPYRAAKKKENIRRQVSIFLLSLFGVALIVFGLNMHLNGQIEILREKIKTTKAQIAKYNKINEEIAEIKKKLELLETKIQVIETLEKNRRLPVETMNELYTNLVPERMWYTKIVESEKGISINGVAIDEHTVADYMTRIDKSSFFKNVRLSAVKQQVLKKQQLKLKSFEIKFDREKKDKAVKTKGKK